MYVLNGWNRKDGEMDQYFTSGEGETAVAIAKIWLHLGWKPVLKSYVGGVHIVNINPIPLRKAA
jgi:hypothetical protein